MAGSWLNKLFRVRTVPASAPRRGRLAFEKLEDRWVPTTFTVLNTGDSGPGSLRQAIADAAASAGPDSIGFDASLTGQTITLASNDANGSFGPTGLVIDNDAITIDGGNAPGLPLSGGDARRLVGATDSGHMSLGQCLV